LAIIADTHLPRGNRRLPASCVALLSEADVIVHAGDLITLDVLEELNSFGAPVIAVHGNVDEPIVTRRLPGEAHLAFEGVRIGVVHDAGPAKGRLARLRARFGTCDAVIFGHSHIPFHQCDGAFQIFNPGSPTDRRRQPYCTMGVARVADETIAFELVRLE
jgi:putative phosphoesterase